MKTILVAATSRDGFITRGADPNVSSWTSDEDKQFFADIKRKHSLFVMGQRTFQAAQVKPTPGILRVILTHNPDQYAELAVAEQLEFHDLDVSAFIRKFGPDYDVCLVLGGGEVYGQFLEAEAIDEAYVTVEPLNFGKGVSLAPQRRRLETFGLHLVDKQKLNESGTELLHFKRK